MSCVQYEDSTLSMIYKRQPIRDGRQIVEKNKRQGLVFSKKLRDSAHWGPEAVEAEFALEAIQMVGHFVKYAKQPQFVYHETFPPICGPFRGCLKVFEVIECVFV